MPERFNGLVLKTSDGQPSVGSNPTLSASQIATPNWAWRRAKRLHACIDRSHHALYEGRDLCEIGLRDWPRCHGKSRL